MPCSVTSRHDHVIQVAMIMVWVSHCPTGCQAAPATPQQLGPEPEAPKVGKAAKAKAAKAAKASGPLGKVRMTRGIMMCCRVCPRPHHPPIQWHHDP